jgi:hypothetical protein
MNEYKILAIIKLIFTSIFMIAMSFIEPIFLYIWGGAVIITVPIVLVFTFINKLYKSEDRE